MNRRGGLWTLTTGGLFVVFGVVIIALGAWIAVSATKATNSPSSGPGAVNASSAGIADEGQERTPAPGPLVADTADAAELDLVEPPLLGKKAVEVLALLPVHAADSGADYQRTKDFGEAWMDVDGNGCSTREDVLLRDLKDTVLNACKVMSGHFTDPYTGQPMSFTRGNDTSTLVQVDHLVALIDAWITGGQQISQDQRQRLANDPTNLIAVSGETNEAKSGSDAAAWLPPFAAMHCEYAARQISVKYAYGLWVTQPEHDALATILQACPDQPAYRSSLGAEVDASAPTPSQTPAAVIAPAGADTGAGAFYANCSAAYAAGVSRIQRDAPGYRAELDRDDDGIACEG